MVSKMEQPSPAVRSSLEQMLESIRRRDGKIREAPPALPARPVSRGRLPSARKSLPVNFKIDSQTEEQPLNGSLEGHDGIGKLNDQTFRSSRMFGSKKPKTHTTAELPYVRTQHLETSVKTSEEVARNSDSVPGPSPSASPLSDGLGLSAVEEYVLGEKLPVWCLLGEADWGLGKIQSISGDEARVVLTSGNVLTILKQNILPANPDILDDVDDLSQLSFSNEPSVLHSLRHRYFNDAIYTKAGPVLVAINPFKDTVREKDLLKAYREKTMDKPHIYMIADNAFNEMMKDGANQSIIICGESGSGKTETAKDAIRYLASVGGGSGLEHKILQTNSILEAFGNAKASLNENSTRFGQLIEINFDEVGKICGANIKTFLLEKSRIVQRAIGERSYHIFYQLCAGASPDLRGTFNLKTASYYEYLKHSDCLTVDNIDDAKKFQNLLEALDTMGVHKKDQGDAFAMLAAILWLGNISFKVVDNENHVEVVLSEGVSNASRLLGCNDCDLILALSTCKIQAGKDSHLQRLTLPEANYTRDALAKSIYAYLFHWLVDEMNKSLEVGKHHRGRSISILDTCGFESLHRNGFEKFCVNYANERLQQHFNRHLFKLKLEEYVEDGIDWRKVNFADNSECLELIEKKPVGLLSLLEEESTFPGAVELMTLANKLKKHLNDNPCFKQERDGEFKIKHYVGEVLYDAYGLLKKNEDPLHPDLVKLLLSSTNQLPKLLASCLLNHSENIFGSVKLLTSADSHKQSVATKLKEQIYKLMVWLEETNPHFVQCIKPNSKLQPGLYENHLVLRQLRCCGVMEVVEISRSGYSTRLTHQKFAERYNCLLWQSIPSRNPLSISVAVLKHLKIPRSMYKVGYTKLFFQMGQIDSLEDLRSRALRGVVTVQKFFRNRRTWCYFQQVKRGSIVIQSFIRGENARSGCGSLIKRQKAVVIIQRHAKGHLSRKMFSSWRKAAISLQCVIRCWLAKHQNLVARELDRQHAKKFTDKPELMPEIVDYSPNYQHVDQSILLELKRRVGKTEKVVQQTEEECDALRQQLKLYETRWLESEAKLKSMEEVWQRQLKSFQSSLAAARKRLPANDLANQSGLFSNSPEPLNYDSEDALSHGARTPDGTAKSFRISDGAPGRLSDTAQHPVNNLVKEFEQRKQMFENDAQHVEANPRLAAPNMNPGEELRKLKLRFSTWKKEYKTRLRAAKLALRKEGHYGAGKHKRKWWRTKKLKAINLIS